LKDIYAEIYQAVESKKKNNYREDKNVLKWGTYNCYLIWMMLFCWNFKSEW
jgi:hypothetical protein